MLSYYAKVVLKSDHTILLLFVEGYRVGNLTTICFIATQIKDNVGYREVVRIFLYLSIFINYLIFYVYIYST